MKLERYLKTHVISPREFARRSGVNVSTIYNILNKKYNPSYPTIRLIELSTGREVTRYDIHSKAYEIWPVDK